MLDDGRLIFDIDSLRKSICELVRQKLDCLGIAATPSPPIGSDTSFRHLTQQDIIINRLSVRQPQVLNNALTRIWKLHHSIAWFQCNPCSHTAMMVPAHYLELLSHLHRSDTYLFFTLNSRITFLVSGSSVNGASRFMVNVVAIPSPTSVTHITKPIALSDMFTMTTTRGPMTTTMCRYNLDVRHRHRVLANLQPAAAPDVSDLPLGQKASRRGCRRLSSVHVNDKETVKLTTEPYHAYSRRFSHSYASGHIIVQLFTLVVYLKVFAEKSFFTRPCS